MGAIHRVITFGRHTLPRIVFLVVGIDPTPGCQNNLYFLCIVSHVIDSISKPTFFLNLLEPLKGLGCLEVSGSV